MYQYSVFGGTLESDTEFPELRSSDGRGPRWSFRNVGLLQEPSELREIGDQHIYGDVHARLFQHREGFRIVVDDTGAFDISASGSEILCRQKSGAWPDFVRAHLLGRVMATALFARGLMPLHGSAVEFSDGVAAFLAPKKFGKSTLALALTAAGGKLVTDDTLPVELGDPIVAWPGVHSVRIAADSLRAMGLPPSDMETREGKGVVTSIDQTRLSTRPAKLSAIYLLNPVAPDERSESEADNDSNEAGDHSMVKSREDAPGRLGRERLPAFAATVALVANFKLARMTGVEAMPDVLKRAAAIASAVPVYRLSVPRNLEMISAVGESIHSWHTAAATGSLLNA